ncbi:MAG: hypothetical protein DRP08_00935 [Candidatus Aenigmatarchaeota archaeon]|nr:hypothetical protein [Candidatus Aenigmarchaeota archaeon]RLJ04759.1 MAG: hypothetical protein DRP08_00935 [Candidatus Aenigmarchaeota archaeon]
MKKVKRKDTILNKKTFKKHEEHGLLLFVTGIVFGLGLTNYLLHQTWFAVLAMLATLIIFYFIEVRD